MNRKVVTISAAALVVGVLIGVLMSADLRVVLRGDTATPVLLLKDDGGRCTVDSKQSVVVVKRGRAVHWDVTNKCDETYAITVGNFRRSVESGNRDCSAATEGGIDLPFNSDDAARTIRDLRSGQSRTITLGGARGTAGDRYYFDICRASGENITKLDPRLWLE